MESLNPTEKYLKELSCAGNDLKELDLTNNKYLRKLKCGDFLTELNLSNNKQLESLDCSYNAISKLDISKNKKLVEVDCTENPLTELNISKNKKMKNLYCDVIVKIIGKTENTNIEDYNYD